MHGAMVDRRFTLALVLAAALVALGAPPVAPRPSDDYLHGYATALLEHRFGLRGAAVRVQDGVVHVDASSLAGADRAQVVAALAAIPGVAGVDVHDAPAPTAGAAPPRAEPAPPGEIVVEPAYQLGALPGALLFAPLVADPRWPHFAASWHYYTRGELGHVATTSFGETFALYRGRAGEGWWEVGLQAGVFALFDLEADSFDLVNADYFVAVPLTYRYRHFSALGRLFHQSSHLGDEFVLGGRVAERINLSYEGLDLTLAWDLGDLVRIYGGAEYLFHREPGDLDPWSTQGGLELRSPWPLPGTAWRPLAAVDVQHHEEHGWDADVSVRAGVQLDGALATRNLQLLVEYFQGHSPHGQFYRQRIEYFGLGAHFHF